MGLFQVNIFCWIIVFRWQFVLIVAPTWKKNTWYINAVEVLTENTHHLLHMLDCFQLYFLLYFFHHFNYSCALSIAILFCCSICCGTVIIFVRPHGQEISLPPPSPSSSAKWWRQREALVSSGCSHRIQIVFIRYGYRYLRQMDISVVWLVS